MLDCPLRHSGPVQKTKEISLSPIPPSLPPFGPTTEAISKTAVALFKVFFFPENMFIEVEYHVRVVIPAKNLDRNGLLARSSIVSCLLKYLLFWKATEEYGYFLAVTKLKSIGNQEFQESSRDILLPVAFSCRTFLPVNGEIMLGVVRAIATHGVFLKCGPMKYIFLSARKMPNYYYVGGKNPFFLSDDLSRIEYNVVIRFVVFAVRWTKKKWEIEREFMILASLEGDCLGPMSLSGSDEMDL
ncbi:hypothetical protein F0562_000435 [Nyssa sinensis]|uniref:DNA-directed RNA polymerase subunit n=1 Tax=Nyssa sinensis TaxID=561372 RepID=A0A5J5C576_9ASTE|nr:hypothetical protein F0562_000435 [Nyssa sinensis]